MPDTTEQSDSQHHRPLRRRIGWFVLLYIGGLAAFAALAALLRLLMEWTVL